MRVVIVFAIAIVVCLLQSFLITKCQAQPILMYHNITNSSTARTGDLFLPLSRFKEHLDWLEKNGWITVTFKDIQAGFKRPKMVVLTFDDGSAGQYLAYKELKRRHMVGVFFITTSFIGGKAWLNSAQIKEMSDQGMEIGCHTTTHPNLTKISLIQAQGQLVNSKAALEKMIGKPVISVAYPYGAYNKHIVKLADDCGFIFGRTTNEDVVEWVLAGKKFLELPIVYIHRNTILSAVFANKLARQ